MRGWPAVAVLAVLAGCSPDDPSMPRLGGGEGTTARRAPWRANPLRAPAGASSLVVKFDDRAQARLDPRGRLVAAGEGDVSAFWQLARDRDLRVRPWLPVGGRWRDLMERAALRARRAQPDLEGTFVVQGELSAEDWERVAAAAVADPAIEVAWFESGPVPPPVDIDPPTDDFVGLQGYLFDEALDVFGARGLMLDGSGVRLTDVEYGWQGTHEEFNEIDTHLEPGQTVHPDAVAEGFVDHGTAVIGILVADEGEYGVTGICPGAELYTYPEWTLEEGPRRATAVANAFADSEAGDVVLLEMQVEEISLGLYGPAELEPGIWMLTRVAADAGIIVVAASGNGGLDLDAPNLEYYRDRGDSGALMVGAGDPLTRQPLPFSTSGSRVDLQGWGDGVATTGYGNFVTVGDDPDQSYTGAFAGTSAAAPMVAGAAVLVQQAARSVGEPLGPELMRQLLVATGRPQGPGAHVGPLPNIPIAALAAMSPDADPPQIEILSPQSLVTEEPTITTDVIVEASNEIGFVRDVRLLINGDEVAVDDQAPFEFLGVVFPSGSWELVATGRDAWGLEGVSPPVVLEVGVAPPVDTGDGSDGSTGEPPPPPPPDSMGTTGEPPPPPDTEGPGADGDAGGCGCVLRPWGRPGAWWLVVLLVAGRRRRVAAVVSSGRGA